MDFIENIENIVFSGGGAKGIFHISAMQILNYERPGWIEKIKRTSGSSIGALFAFLIACQTPFPTIVQLMVETKCEDILSKCTSTNFKEKSGVMNMRGIEIWIENYLETVMGLKRNATFHDLYVKTGIQLVICVSNITKHTIFYFGTPGLEHEPIALRMADSMALPFIFERRIYKGEWVGDGGTFNNIPYEPFGLEKTIVLMFEIHDGHREKVPFQKAFIDIIYACNNFIHLEKIRHIPEHFQSRIMMIPYFNVSTAQIKLTPQQRLDYIQKSYTKMAFDRNHLPQLISQCLVELLQINLENNFENKK